MVDDGMARIPVVALFTTVTPLPNSARGHASPHENMRPLFSFGVARANVMRAFLDQKEFVMNLVRLLPAAALVLSASFAFAQTAPAPTNPLRPGSSRTTAPATQTTAPAATTTAPAPTTDAAGKPKRARSQAQLANDQRMRDCGAEWRANKPALQAQGKTWKVFNVECRARLKAQGR